MVAPYSLLAGYKHKVKLTPGNQRKGKAARQARLLLRLLPLARCRGSQFGRVVRCVARPLDVDVAVKSVHCLLLP